MVRIAIVIPYASMANLAWDVFQEHTEQMRLQALDATEYSLVLLCKQAAKIFQTICKKETALKRVLRNLLSAISFAQI